MRVAVYSRVSTEDQNVNTQRTEISNFCQYKGWNDLTHFQDEGISGTKTSRPALDEMMGRVREGEFDAVVVWRFDRASRSLSHLLAVLEELNAIGVAFVSIKEQIDTSTPAGRLMFSMVGAFAQFERDVIAQRTSAAMQRMKSEGKTVSRPRSVNWDKIKELKAQGVSTKEISKKFGLSASHIRRICREAA